MSRLFACMRACAAGREEKMATLTKDENVISDDERSWTQKEFMFLENVSESTYYKMKRLGHGPKETIIPVDAMYLVRITAQARRDWHAQLEALAQSEAGQLMAKRRVELATQAGKLAAASPKHISHRAP